MQYSTVADAAELVGVTPRTIFRWIKAGHLRKYQAPGSNATRVNLDELHALMRGDQ
jgi:excisionase family DNA binding protein